MPDDLAGAVWELEALVRGEPFRQIFELSPEDARALARKAEASSLLPTGVCDWCDRKVAVLFWYPIESCPGEFLNECSRCHENANGNEKRPRTWIGRLFAWFEW